jgi:hypothetical protein
MHLLVAPSVLHPLLDFIQINIFPEVFQFVHFHLPEQPEKSFACHVNQLAIFNR